jgi:hypothetical protein
MTGPEKQVPMVTGVRDPNHGPPAVVTPIADHVIGKGKMKFLNYLRVLASAAIDWANTEDRPSNKQLLLPRNEALKLVRRHRRKPGRLLWKRTKRSA